MEITTVEDMVQDLKSSEHKFALFSVKVLQKQNCILYRFASNTTMDIKEFVTKIEDIDNLVIYKSTKDGYLNDYFEPIDDTFEKLEFNDYWVYVRFQSQVRKSWTKYFDRVREFGLK